MPIYYDELAGWAHPADVFVLLHKDDENSFWLDREHHWDARFSVIGSSPKLHTGNAIQLLAQSLAEQEVVDLPFEFRPGLVGVVEYEGLASFMHIDRAIVFDHQAKSFFLIGEFASAEEYEAWKQAALLRIGLCGGEQAGYRLFKPALRASAIKAKLNDEEYLAAIEQAKHYIAEGQVYQICLTNRLRLEVEGDALSTFMQLRESNPAPYAAYFKFGARKVVCASPEQFLHVDALGHMSSKPIKGTRPRYSDSVRDEAARRELAENQKERAENLMIVDLMRNDLGSVAKPDTVAVTKLFDVESYATVHQLVSTVEAELAPGKTAVDALVAAFPGGSMTGAPKRRAMQLIGELEGRSVGSARNVYSGIAGFMTHGGVADFGMVIRTLVVEHDHAYIGVGGGITSDSVAEEELAEIKVKAAALLKVLEIEYP